MEKERNRKNLIYSFGGKELIYCYHYWKQNWL